MIEAKTKKCEMCNGTGQIGEEQSYYGRSVGWKVCPKCNDESTPEEPEE